MLQEHMQINSQQNIVLHDFQCKLGIVIDQGSCKFGLFIMIVNKKFFAASLNMFQTVIHY